MKHSKKILVAALGLLVVGSMPAHAGGKKVNNYVISGDGTLVRDSEKNCVRSSDKTTKLRAECGDVPPKAKKMPVKEKMAAPKKVLEHIVINNIQFDFDSANLTASDKTILDGVTAKVSKYSGNKMTVTGYTDTSGPEAYNLQLSERRANAVADYLAASGIDRGNMTVSGMGEANPIADNSTREGRIRNRRVEVDVIEK